MYQPDVHRTDGLPDAVTVYEVSPRDGLQNEPTVVDVAVKAELVRRLAAAGLTAIETTSFVPATWIPQLADAADLLERLGPAPVGSRRPVLVPNLRGLERALDAGVEEIVIFGSATETFARRNLNRTIDESLAIFAPVVETAKARGVAVRGYLSMCFGDPWEGAVPPRRVAAIARRIVDLGADELSIGDTIGVATPGHVEALLAELADVGIGPGILAAHFHDTYGQALANTLTALRAGVRTVDASAGGLGGCPYAKSATGNLATEDLVWMLHGLGIHTGVDLAELTRTSRWMARQLGRPSPSRVARALAGQLAEDEADRRGSPVEAGRGGAPAEAGRDSSPVDVGRGSAPVDQDTDIDQRRGADDA